MEENMREMIEQHTDEMRHHYKKALAIMYFFYLIKASYP